MRRPPVTTLLLAAVLAAGCGGDDPKPRRAASPSPAPAQAGPAAPPAPDAPIPRSPKRLAPRLAATQAELQRAILDWRATNPGKRARPPERVTLLALYTQRAYRMLARHPGRARATIKLLPRDERAAARDSVGALHALFTLTSLPTEARFRVHNPLPPDVLLGFYRKAQTRFHVRWSVLAAVNMVETNFGRLRNVSSAGAVGPMQFIPSTWRAYGLGGNIRDPHDAIMGAANYLHASGAPGSYSRALYAYNPSRLYVRAVLRYARRIASRPARAAYYAYWSWQSFKRTRNGDLQLTGPGADESAESAQG